MNDRFFFEMPTLLILKKKKKKKQRKFRVGGFIEITNNFIISHLQNKTTFFQKFHCHLLMTHQLPTLISNQKIRLKWEAGNEN